MHPSARPEPTAAAPAVGLPLHGLRLPTRGETRPAPFVLFADTPGTAWLVDVIAAHQNLPEIDALCIQCWTLDVPEQGSPRLSCQGWRGGPDLVSMLVPTRCLRAASPVGVPGSYAFIVANGTMWTEQTWCQTGEDGP